jgi:hypothetical protein
MWGDTDRERDEMEQREARRQEWARLDREAEERERRSLRTLVQSAKGAEPTSTSDTPRSAAP